MTDPVTNSADYTLCQIVAIARTRDAAVATRNAGDFADCGIVVLDPWTAGPTAP